MEALKQWIAGLSLAVLCVLPLAAQGTNQPAPDISVPSPQDAMARAAAQKSAAPAVPVPSTADAPEVNNAELRPVCGELQSRIDTRDAKAGDVIVLRTTESAAIANGMVIPKGSKIIGHVTQVRAQGGGNPDGKLTVQFDRAQLRDGQMLQIRTVLQSIAPVSEAAAGASRESGGPNAHRLGAENVTAGCIAQRSVAQGGTAARSSGVSGSAIPVGTVLAHEGDIEIKTTSIPGVLLASNADGQPFSNASGAILGARQNVHLDGGTQVTLAVAAGGEQTHLR